MCLILKPAAFGWKSIGSLIMGVFCRHGVINRLVLPPHGLSALIDFAEAVEARSAFTKLAYTKFKNAPLYLEWAPADAFKQPFVKQEEEEVVRDVLINHEKYDIMSAAEKKIMEEQAKYLER